MPKPGFTLVVSALLFVCALSGAATPTAPPTAPQWLEGQHYFRLSPPQATNLPADKLALTEVFSYGCPACNQFQPYMLQLRRQLPANVVINYLPAGWIAAEDWPMFQRAYLTAKSMGIADATHDEMFVAIWQTGELGIADPVTRGPKTQLPSLDDAARFYERKTGVPAANFLSAASSFLVNLNVQQADQQIQNMRVERTPTLIVNGKYRIDPTAAGGYAKMVELARWLLARESPAAAAPMTSAPTK